MKVLFVSAEVVPFSKTGGLADVAYSLPRVLREEKVDIRVMTPKNFHNKKTSIDEIEIGKGEIEVGWRKQYMGVSTATYNELTYYFIDNEYYFKRENLYGYFDDGERYSYFCKAVLEAIRMIDFTPDIIHFNDWHTAMIPLLMKKQYSYMEKFKNIKTVFTIHNLKYQGVFDKKVMNELLNLDYSEFDSGAVEFYGNVNFMKSGIVFSDAITTVSENYSNEIKEVFFGENLHDIINMNSYKLYGIVNGIDFEIYNPETDKRIKKNYSFKNSSFKNINKKYLQEKFGLVKAKNKPLIAMVTRLTNQKGLDLLECVIEELLALDIQMVVLGTGDEKYEKLLMHYNDIYKNLAVKIEFNEDTAHQIYAGADMFLMPSLFEPCGLSQMISQRYGTIPIVRETGGLKDTVSAYNKFTKEGTGFSFDNYNAHEMLFAIKRAIEVYKSKDEWRNLVKRVMKLDLSWRSSALKYKELYERLLD
ncbi:MAG: glycogen synthase GlgA [Clostridiales bacterium]|nr:glycogen synthase GlgA [Clostridiales bacterium]